MKRRIKFDQQHVEYTYLSRAPRLLSTSFHVFTPMFLLTSIVTITRVPTAVILRFFQTVRTLKRVKK